MIYESRPNVTIEAASLCLKANAVILRGGSEAIHSNTALGQSLANGLSTAGLPVDAAQVVPMVDRAAVGALLTMPEYIDLIVPRGGKGLIERVMAESQVAILKHLDGICHVYIDTEADPDKAHRIAFNAKTQRYGTCNTMETLLIAKAQTGMLPALVAALQRRALRFGDAMIPVPLPRLFQSPRQTPIGRPNISRRFYRSRLSMEWTRRWHTSRNTALLTPRAS